MAMNSAAHRAARFRLQSTGRAGGTWAEAAESGLVQSRSEPLALAPVRPSLEPDIETSIRARPRAAALRAGPADRLHVAGSLDRPQQGVDLLALHGVREVLRALGQERE